MAQDREEDRGGAVPDGAAEPDAEPREYVQNSKFSVIFTLKSCFFAESKSVLLVWCSRGCLLCSSKHGSLRSNCLMCLIGKDFECKTSSCQEPEVASLRKPQQCFSQCFESCGVVVTLDQIQMLIPFEIA